MSALSCSLITPTILLGFLLPWTWGISSQLFQQAQPLLLTLNEGYLLTTTPPDLELGIGPLGTASLVAQMVKRLPAMRETQVRSLGWEDPLEKEMVTHSSTLAWKIPWTEEPGRLQSMGSQRVGHDRTTSLHFTSHYLNK